MSIFTITINNKENFPPDQIGNNTIDIEHGENYSFKVSDFTTNTIPKYNDPEGDNLKFLKVITLPTVGELTLFGSTVDAGDIIENFDIYTGDFKYQADISNENSYIDSTFSFDIADTGSEEYSNLTPGIITLNVAEKENLPPNQVGDNSFTLNYGETLTFTVDDFTTDTTPPYSDPEGDAAYALKITSLPTDGELRLNNVPISLNAEILFTDIANGLFTLVPSLGVTNGDTLIFNVEISDIGSKIFVG